MTGLRVVVADDDVLLREGLSQLLVHAGMEVVGRAGDAVALRSSIASSVPDVAIVDIRMPPTGTTEGLDAARVIRKSHPGVGLLVLSAHVEVEHATELLASDWGIGYLLKSRVTDVGEFVDAVKRVAAGGTVLEPALVRELVSFSRRTDLLGALTAREREVLALMAEGRSNHGIAQRIFVSEGTVEKHVRHIFTKLELADVPDDHRRVRAVIAFLSRR